jgi:hypothetical protein
MRRTGIDFVCTQANGSDRTAAMLKFAFVFGVPSLYLRCLYLAAAKMTDEFVVFVVGGVTYPICKRDIEKHPDSFLSTAVRKEWHDGKKSIHVDRDSDLFRHIYVCLVGGCLSKEAMSSTDGPLLDSICLEADFYGLPELAKECTVAKVIAPFNTYQDVRRVVENCGSSRIRIDCPMEQTTPLLKALGTIFVPFCK